MKVKLNTLEEEMDKALNFFIKHSNLKKGNSVILGGSTSEILGYKVGSSTNLEVSDSIVRSFVKKMKENKLYPLIQACEHINRALVVERAYAEKYDLMPVNVIPHPKAGGGFATSAMEELDDPVVITKARRVFAGIDIGDVFIAMHLDQDRVGVVLRPDYKKIGRANLTMITTREQLIGGNRAAHKK